MISSISTNSLTLPDRKNYDSPTRGSYGSSRGYLNAKFNSANDNSHLQQEQHPYFTRSVAKRIASEVCLSDTKRTINKYSIPGDSSLPSLSFNQVTIKSQCITPSTSTRNFTLIGRIESNRFSNSYSNFGNLERHSIDRHSSSRRRNPNGSYMNLRGSQVVTPFQPPTDAVDFPGGGCRKPIPWCKYLSIIVLIAILTPTVWYIHGHFCATQTFFNKVEEDLCKLQEQMERMKHNVVTGTNQQLQTMGKDTNQKLAEVEQMLKEIKSCPQSSSDSSEMDCCATFDSADESPAFTASTGRPDFALESSGGSIIGVCDTEQFEPGSASGSVFGIPICCSRNGPRAVIQANVQPGECWAFKGCSGTVTIKLLGFVYLSGVTLEHIPKSISPSGDIDSAPNEFSIVGLEDEFDTEGNILGTFAYKSNGPPAQFFAIDGCPQSYEVIQLQIHSNHGNPRFTCVYRLQVHGKLDEAETQRLEGQ